MNTDAILEEATWSDYDNCYIIDVDVLEDRGYLRQQVVDELKDMAERLPELYDFKNGRRNQPSRLRLLKQRTQSPDPSWRGVSDTSMGAGGVAEVRGLEANGSNQATVDYPFPLESGEFARFRIPRSMSSGDVERIAKFLESLVVER